MGNYRVRYVIEYDIVADDKYHAQEIARDYIYNEDHGLLGLALGSTNRKIMVTLTPVSC